MPDYTVIVQIPLYCIDTTKEEIEDNWREILLEQIKDAITDAEVIKIVEE